MKWPKKTVIRRLAKRLPMSSDIERVFDHDNEIYDFKQAPLVVEEDETTPKVDDDDETPKQTRAARKVKAKEKPAEKIDAETGEIFDDDAIPEYDNQSESITDDDDVM